MTANAVTVAQIRRALEVYRDSVPPELVKKVSSAVLPGVGWHCDELALGIVVGIAITSGIPLASFPKEFLDALNEQTVATTKLEEP
jgi:hypothetical protein